MGWCCLVAKSGGLAREWLDADVCDLDGSSLQLRQGLRDVDAVLAPANLKKMEHLFESVPITNIGSEEHFAGMHTRACTSRSSAPVPTTQATEHVLAESKMVLNSMLE